MMLPSTIMARIANASTTDQASIVTLAQQLVTDSNKVHDGGVAQQLAQPVLTALSSSTFDWNEVMFGTDSLSSWQTSVAVSLTPTIAQFSTFNVTTTTQATQIINTAISDLQSLNSSIQESDAIAFLQTLVNNGPSTMLALLSLPNSQQYASTLHGSFAGDLASSSSAIQAIFSVTGPASTSNNSNNGSGNAGSAANGTGSAGGTSTGSGTNSTGSGANSTTSGSSSSTSYSGTTSSFNSTLDIQAVSSTGGELTASEGNNQIQLSIPAGAIASSELVAITGADVSTMNSLVPNGYEAVTAVGVTFSSAAPTQSVTLTIQNQAITASSVVYKIANGALTPLQAMVTTGQAVITFSTDPDFLIVTPTSSDGTSTSTSTTTSTTSTTTTTTPAIKLGVNQRAILLNGKVIIVPVVVKYHTTYMPIWYVGQALQQLGDNYQWNGRDWRITTPSSIFPDYSKLSPGKGTMAIYLDGKLVQRVTGIYAIDPSTQRMTTYMPIWYVMQMLKRVDLNTVWNGKEWSFPASK